MMEACVEDEVAVNLARIEKMAASWPGRAAVRGDLGKYAADYLDPERPDYPIELVPFARHPRYLAASPAQRREILTWGWLVYNDRTIQSEEHLANPAFTAIMHGAWPGAEDIRVRQSVQQCLVDEHFHTLMHTTAIHETRAWRGIDQRLDCPPSITWRRLVEAQARPDITEPWQRSLLLLIFGVVAEVSIKAYLNLIAENDVIQPKHRMIALMHNRDEAAHGQILVEVTKVLWNQMAAQQRRFFIAELPGALSAFVEHDFSAWRAILQQVGLEGADEVIGDCQAEAAETKKMVRDVSGVRQLGAELGILHRLDFQFA
jgi:4-aminobenzoate N-oxygenase